MVVARARLYLPSRVDLSTRVLFTSPLIHLIDPTVREARANNQQARRGGGGGGRGQEEDRPGLRRGKGRSNLKPIRYQRARGVAPSSNKQLDEHLDVFEVRCGVGYRDEGIRELHSPLRLTLLHFTSARPGRASQ